MRILQDAVAAAINLAYNAGEKVVQYMGKVYQHFTAGSATGTAEQVNKQATKIVNVDEEMKKAMAQFNTANKKVKAAIIFDKPLAKLPSDSELLNELGMSSGKF